MIIHNTNEVYERVQRHIGYVQLFKLVKLHTELKEVNGIIETAVIGRDYEFVSLPLTEDMDIVNGVDPLEVNFESFYTAGLEKELNDIRNSKIQEVREIRWKVVSSKVFNNKIFSNLAAERNANLLFMSIERYRKGKYVNWMNLNGDYININDDNIGALKALYDKISDFTQYTFDTINVVISEIKAIQSTDELLSLDVKGKWDSAFEKTLALNSVGE